MNITIVGCGYVGLTTSVALAYLGHQVTLLDVDRDKICALQHGVLPIHEPGLSELFPDARLNMHVVGAWDAFDGSTDIILIAVGTPAGCNGKPDLSYVEAVATELGNRLEPRTSPVVVCKSTVPPGTTRRVKSVIDHTLRERGVYCNYHIAANPEFLREGNALFDTFYPDRIVIGVDSTDTQRVLYNLYSPILQQSFASPTSLQRPEKFPLPTLITTTPESAELTKYAANAFLAMKISFINEFAKLAELVGADITHVAKGIGVDKRIGSRYLQAGVGWGGSCFGKDTAAILHTAKEYGYEMPIVASVRYVNERQREYIVHKLQSQLKVLRGRTLGVLGIAFKPNTSDMREAPSIDVIDRLLEHGAYVKIYDPIAIEQYNLLRPGTAVESVDSVEALFMNCDAVLMLTEWDEFQNLPYEKLGKLMKERRIIDARNALDKNVLQQAGFFYSGIGR